MTSIQLKKFLIQRITEINDDSFLNAIKTILEVKTQTITLNQEQLSDIKESKKEIKKGNFIDQSSLDNEFNQWLNEK